MKVATGRVVEGKVALLEAMTQADRGQVVSWEALREQLRRSP